MLRRLGEQDRRAQHPRERADAGRGRGSINTVAMSWFSAGMRLYNIGDMYRPEEIAVFLPDTPPGRRGSRINDVFVEDRGVIHALDRFGGGLYTLEYTGAEPLS